MSRQVIFVEPKTKRIDAPKCTKIGKFFYPLTVHRPPQKPGELWIQVTVNTPVQLAVELLSTCDNGQKR